MKELSGVFNLNLSGLLRHTWNVHLLSWLERTKLHGMSAILELPTWLLYQAVGVQLFSWL